MKERSQITLLVMLLLIVGAGFAYFTVYGSKFTFYKAELTIQGNSISEKLYYTPNKEYHTLYRNFESPVRDSTLPHEYATIGFGYDSGSIAINDVTCSNGRPYYSNRIGITTILGEDPGAPLSHTESNEYGCGFGEIAGFSEDEEYIIGASYTLRPDTLIEHEGKYYIKFVAYSGSRHPLISPKTLIVNGDAIYAKYVAASSEFLIYIPYEPTDISEYNILHESKLRTSNNSLALLMYIIIALIPAIICFLVWQIFGKEYAEGDYPEELSQYPSERKAWEVSIYFHPPFGDIDESFMPSMILDFYHRKIVDIQFRKTGKVFKRDEIFLRILPNNVPLDNVETEFMDFLKYVKSLDESKDEYFSIRSISEKWGSRTAMTVGFSKLKKELKDASKEYIEYAGTWILITAILVTLVLSVIILGVIGESITQSGNYKLYIIPVALIVGIFIKKTSLFIRFKKDHYKEYQQWQGFKNYLSHLDSIPRTKYQGVVMWEKYLIYATCLGVGKEVLKQMRKLNVVSKEYYDKMTIVYTHTAFGTTTAPQGGAGGMGGGGGIGGGGGGGR